MCLLDCTPDSCCSDACPEASASALHSPCTACTARCCQHWLLVKLGAPLVVQVGLLMPALGMQAMLLVLWGLEWGCSCLESGWTCAGRRAPLW